MKKVLLYQVLLASTVIASTPSDENAGTAARAASQGGKTVEVFHDGSLIQTWHNGECIATNNFGFLDGEEETKESNWHAQQFDGNPGDTTEETETDGVRGWKAPATEFFTPGKEYDGEDFGGVE